MGSFENPARKHNVRDGSLSSPYSRQFSIMQRLHPKVIEEITKHLPESTVIDVGGGGETYMMNFALNAGAEKYINVDIQSHGNKFANAPEKVELVQADILAYLLDGAVFSQHKKSTNFILSGLDGHSFNKDDDYIESMLSLIAQYMKKGDYIFGIHAPQIVEVMKNDDFSKEFSFNKSIKKDTHFFVAQKT